MKILSKILIILSFFLVSCGSYQHASYRVKSVLAITEKGDTIAVPIREFERQKYDNYTRFRFNNNWYWNNWRHTGFNNGWWGVNQPWWYLNTVDPRLYWNADSYRIPARPKTQPRTRPRPRVNQPRPQPRPRVNPPRVQTTPNVIQRTNVGRNSSGGSRSSGRGKQNN